MSCLILSRWLWSWKVLSIKQRSRWDTRRFARSKRKLSLDSCMKEISSCPFQQGAAKFVLCNPPESIRHLTEKELEDHCYTFLATTLCTLHWYTVNIIKNMWLATAQQNRAAIAEASGPRLTLLRHSYT